MKVFKVNIRNHIYTFTAHITPTKPFIDGIINSKSNNPKALPLRGNKGVALPDWASDSESRNFNRDNNSELRKIYYENNLLTESKSLSGLYFFLKHSNDSAKYYYIGKANSIGRRVINEHFKNKDFIFYSIAYPLNRVLYLDEVLCYYGEKMEYAHLKEEYKIESNCLEEVIFDHIAWIGCNQFTMKIWKAVETHFISSDKYKPCCNVKERNSVPSELVRLEFEEVESVLNQLLYT